MIDRYTRPEMAALWTKQKKFETWLEVELNATDAGEAGQGARRGRRRDAQKREIHR